MESRASRLCLSGPQNTQKAPKRRRAASPSDFLRKKHPPSLDRKENRGKVMSCSLKTDYDIRRHPVAARPLDGLFWPLRQTSPRRTPAGSSPVGAPVAFFWPPPRRARRTVPQGTDGRLTIGECRKGNGTDIPEMRVAWPSGRARGEKKSPRPLAKTESRDNLRMSPEGLPKSRGVNEKKFTKNRRGGLQKPKPVIK